MSNSPAASSASIQEGQFQDLDRGQKLFLADKLVMGLEKRTVRNIQSGASAPFSNAAMEDGLIGDQSRCKPGAGAEIDYLEKRHIRKSKP